MPAAEMHEMENAALEDPFLADAMEGYAQTTVDLQTDSADLQSRLAKRTAPSKVVRLPAFRWTRIAAAVIFVLAGSGLIYSLVNLSGNEKTMVAKNEQQSSTVADSSVADTITPPVASESVQNFKMQDTTAASVTANIKSAPQDVVTRELQPSIPRAEIKAEEEVQQSDVAMNRKFDVSERKEMAAPVSKQLEGRAAGITASSARKQTMPRREAHMLKGKIVNPANKPLPGAEVLVQDKSVGVITDKDGNFNMLVPDSTVKVEINLRGYEKATALVASRSSNEIVLTPVAQQLAEVVVTGYGNERRSTQTGAVSSIAQLPGDFNNYIIKNRKIPDTIQNANAIVTLSFVVNRKGRPTDVKVEKSLQPSADKEAIRLLTEGPDWKQPKQKRNRTFVNINF